MVEATTESTAPEQPRFTCLSCSIAFLSAEDQRVHYRSDHHRYNMKRRVASLPPVSAAVFNEKVVQRQTETAVTAPPKPKGSNREAPKPKPNPTPSTTSAASTTKNVASDDEVNQTIDEKIAAARSTLSPLNCLFCPVSSASLSDNLTHMSSTHSFFIPDADYLVDINGLIAYLGEKLAVGNVCIHCNEKGKEFRSLDAVRKHMVDKSHCKIAYDNEDDRLEVSDFYDFTTSYPAAVQKKKKKAKQKGETNGKDEGWEDLEGNGSDDDVDEVVDESEEEDSEGDDIPENQLTYGDTEYELVLPSGARIGHRSMRRYYAQSFRSVGGKEEDPNSGAALVRRLLADKNSALIPRKGGFGAFGQGTEVIKARNRGEAREAGRHVREFRDQKRREDFKTKVGFIHNSQKHFRDPLLQ